MTKRILIFITIFVLPLIAVADNKFIIGINVPINDDNEALNVNAKNPSDTQALSLQDASTLELGYQFNLSPRFGTDVSIIRRYSNVGVDGLNNPLDSLSDLRDIIECLFRSSGPCDNTSQNFDSASFSPYGMQAIPFYKVSNFHIGAGVVLYVDQDIKVKYNDSTVEKIAFDNARGAVLKASYFFSRCCSLAFTYEDISFSTNATITNIQGNTVKKIDGSNLAIGFKARF